MQSVKNRKDYTPTQTALAEALVNRQFTCSCGGKFQNQGLGGKPKCKVLQARCGICRKSTSQTELIKVVNGTYTRLQATLEPKDQQTLKALLEKAAVTKTSSSSSGESNSSGGESNSDDHPDSHSNSSDGEKEDNRTVSTLTSERASSMVESSPLPNASSPRTPKRRVTLVALSPVPSPILRDEGDEEMQSEMEEGEVEEILSRSTAAFLNCSSRTSPGGIMTRRDQQTLVDVLGQVIEVQTVMRKKMVEMESELQVLKAEVQILRTHPPSQVAPQPQRQPQPRQQQQQQQKEKAREQAPGQQRQQRQQQAPLSSPTSSAASPSAASPSAARTRPSKQQQQQHQSPHAAGSFPPPSPGPIASSSPAPTASSSPAHASSSSTLSLSASHGRSLTVRHPESFNAASSMDTIRAALVKAGVRPSAMIKFAMNGKELRILARSAPAAWAIRCRLLDSSRSCLVRMLTSQEEKTIFSC